MTGLYDWNPMPHILAVNCPECGKLSEYEFAEVVKIRLRRDIDFFKDCDFFEYRLFRDSGGQNWHGAIYFAGLHGGTVAAIRDLPEGYRPEDWSHSEYLVRSGQGVDLGSICCKNCHVRGEHVLTWPEDAHYSIEYRGEVLWAFNRESAVDLRNYVDSKSRDISGYRWRSLLLHMPSTFKKQGAREHVVKRLNRLLGSTSLS